MRFGQDELISPRLNAAACSSVKLSFRWVSTLPTDVYTVGVDVSVNGGSTWTTVWTGSYKSSVQTQYVTIDQLVGKDNGRIRFWGDYFCDNDAMCVVFGDPYFRVDDVKIYQP